MVEELRVPFLLMLVTFEVKSLNVEQHFCVILLKNVLNKRTEQITLTK